MKLRDETEAGADLVFAGTRKGTGLKRRQDVPDRRHSLATVSVVMGMGVRFTDVQLEQHGILEGWLAALVRS